MRKQVSDVTVGDSIIIEGAVVLIDMVPIEDENVVILDGYFIESGADFCHMFNNEEEVVIAH